MMRARTKKMRREMMNTATKAASKEMMRTMTKASSKILMRIIMVIIITLSVTRGYPISANAQEASEETQLAQFMKTLQKIDAKAEPDENAETVFSYDEGASVYVTGETADGWYIALYQGKIGYIKKDISQDVLVVEEIDIEALNEEMAAQEAENKMIVEEVERYRAEARRSRVWGTIIVLLVLGIFAVGIVSTIRTEKKNESSKDDQDILDLDREEVN